MSSNCHPSSSTIVGSNLCIFCFKNEKDATRKAGSGRGRVKNKEEDSIVVVRRFFTLVQRYFEEKTGSFGSPKKKGRGRPRKLVPFLPLTDDLEVRSCADCFEVVSSYCDVYHQMKMLELELDKLLNKLENVMTETDSDPSIMTGVMEEKRKLGRAMEFRRNFRRQCAQGILEMFPKITLKRRSPNSCQNQKKSSDSNHEALKSRQSRALIKKTGFMTEPLSLIVDDETPFLIRIKISPPDSPIHNQNEDEDWLMDADLADKLLEEDGQDIRNPDWVADIDDLSCDVDTNENMDLAANVNHRPDNENDWMAPADDIDVEVPREKRKYKKKKKRGPSKKIEASVECVKCRTTPLPSFNSAHKLQIHQEYLHSNGYAALTVSENSQFLHLSEKDLKLEGIETSIKHCSGKFPECSQEFMLEEELINHQKYHGDVTCDICGIVNNYAVDLVHHEISHLLEAADIESTEQKATLTCRKCASYSTSLEVEFINHYLKFHLDKPIIQSKCPICQQQFEFVDKVPFIHYLNYHDLTRLEDPASKGIQCTHQDCSAYFLTEDQLQHHFDNIHPSSATNKARKPLETKFLMKALKYRRKRIKFKSKERDQECDQCAKKFRSQYELKKHISLRHSKAQKEEGGKLILTEDGLTIDEFCMEDKCVCDICDKILTSSEQLESHKRHHGDFQCNFCDVTKPLATELAVHETVHKTSENKKSSAAGSINCPRCTYKTKHRLDYIDHHLEIHLKLKSDRKRCPICRKTIPSLAKKKAGTQNRSRYWMIAHFKDYHDTTGLEDPEKSLRKCELCPAYFKNPIQLHNHSREYHGRHKIHECMDCVRSFKDADVLRSHRISKHKVDVSTFQFSCSLPECAKKFERQIELDYHEHSAHNDKEVAIQICPVCGKKCTGTGQLAGHMTVHDKIEAEEVEEQEKRGPRIKIEETEFVCDQCGKIFAKKCNLKAHLKIHLGKEAWKHECSICGKMCCNKAKLEEHIRMHTKEKPYICQICGDTFVVIRNLRRHVQKKHGGTDADADCQKSK